jgi:hypothetical protein
MEKDKIMIIERHVFWKYDPVSGGFFKTYKEIYDTASKTDGWSDEEKTRGFRMTEPCVVKIKAMLDEHYGHKLILRTVHSELATPFKRSNEIIKYLKAKGISTGGRRGVKRVLKNVCA